MSKMKLLAGVILLCLVVVMTAACSGGTKSPSNPTVTPTPGPTITPVSEDGSQKVAEQFVKNDATFLFDGIRAILELTRVVQSGTGSWTFTWSFQSAHAGYGDRTGQMLAQVVMPHVATITVTDGKVVSATMDGTWNMMTNSMINLNAQTGMLAGTVTIGPLSPVERPGITPTPAPEVYDARKIMVYDASGNKLIKEVSLNHDGTYSVNLNPGVYLVDIKHTGMDRSSDVPKTVEIKAGESVRLDISIDTGIR